MGEVDLIVSSWPTLQRGTHAERDMVLKVLRGSRILKMKKPPP